MFQSFTYFCLSSIFRTPYDASVWLLRLWYHVVVIFALIGVVGIVVVIGFVDVGVVLADTVAIVLLLFVAIFKYLHQK